MPELNDARGEVVFLLPGLGATCDLFADYQLPFPTCAVEYPAPHSQTMGLPEYALQLISENGIRSGDSLIGVSLGGMLCIEIARLVPIRKLTLISSCTDSRHIRPFIRRLHPLSRLIPWRLIQRAPFPSCILSQSRRRALAMLRIADADFIPWACVNAAVWQCPAHQPDIVQIHGDKDPVFPISRQTIHHTISGGDHLMVLSHRQEIEAILIARHCQGEAEAI